MENFTASKISNKVCLYYISEIHTDSKKQVASFVLLSSAHGHFLSCASSFYHITSNNPRVTTLE